MVLLDGFLPLNCLCKQSHADILDAFVSYHLQLDEWVGTFTTQSIMLADACVWTKSASDALKHTSHGQPQALHALHDQTVLRLETLGQQLRPIQQQMIGVIAQQPESTTTVPSASANHQAPDADDAVQGTTHAGNEQGSHAKQHMSEDSMPADFDPDATMKRHYPKQALGSEEVKHASSTPVRAQTPEPRSKRQPAAGDASTSAPEPASHGHQSPSRRSSMPGLALQHISNSGVNQHGAYAAHTAASVSTADPGLSQQQMRGLQCLITVGVFHRDVVQQLQHSKATGQSDFEWGRQLRHYWDAPSQRLLVSGYAIVVCPALIC